ncbi:MAG TPA: dihydrolipoyllysine-residue acetyltransferase [Solimonas sp.]
MAKTIDIKVPDIGDYQGVPVIEVLVKDGDTVAAEQPILVLESDKATMEVPAPAAGVVRGLKLKVGDKVSQGDAIGQLETGGADDAAAPAPAGKDSKPTADKRAPTPKADAAAPASPKATTGANAKPAGGRKDVRVPDIGNYQGVPVIEVLVADGDAVEAEQPLLVLESDKATMEVPAPAAGIVRDLKLKVGDKVSQGDVVCVLEGAASEAAAETAPAPAPSQPAPAAPAASSDKAPTAVKTETAGDAATPATSAAAKADSEAPYAGPATRKYARQLGVDLAQVQGSGTRGRIQIEDVQSFVKRRLSTPAAGAAVSGGGIPPIPAVDFSQFGEIETKALARIRKLSAAHLHRAWVNVPHVTQTDEADITDLETFRKAQSEEGGVKLTLLPFIIKAVSVALKQYPEFNASLAPDGENLILKKYVHIGFAADTPNGLVVPVVRHADQKGIVQLAQETAELAKKARDGKLKPDEMKGGCFSISSLGGIGGSFFTPIVNAPEVGILGVSKSQMKPVWDGKTFQPRLMCPLSLSYDHRVIDGAYAARFIVLLGKLLSDLRRLTL